MAKNGETSNPTPQAPVLRTSAGLRDAIFDEIDAIRAGTSNATRANAVAKLANTVVETVRMELEVQRHVRSIGSEKTPEVQTPPSIGAPLTLGSPKTIA